MSSHQVLINQVEVYKSSIKLKEPFVISLGTTEYAESIFVVIRTNAGITGFGECSPSITINGETPDTCFSMAQYLAKILLGKNALNIDSCCAWMDKIMYNNTSIKSAFDIAMYDIAAQHAQQPIYKFIGGNNTKILKTDYTVGIGTPEKMANDAIKIIENGFQIVKVKLGRTKEEDVQRIAAIRKAIGLEIPVRIDANQGWDTAMAIETLNALAPLNIEFCEEPISRFRFTELPEVNAKSPIPVMADESLCTHHDAEWLINNKACGMFNIKLGKSSGFHKAIKIVKLAEQNNIKIQIGGFLESRLATTGSAHLALMSEAILHCDFDAPLMAVADPVVDGIVYDKQGIITVPDKPGLGASIDEGYLKTLVKQVNK